MSGGSSSTPPAPTQTTTQVLSPEQQQILKLAMPGIREFAAKPLQRYQGEQVAPFTPEQTAGQEKVLGAVPAQTTLANKAADTSNFILGGDIWNPESNPNLQRSIDAAVRPVYQNLTETALPAIRSGAQAVGPYGGSRQGIAEGLAIRGADQTAADTAAKIAEDEYRTNIQAQLSALGLLPTVQGAQVTPGVTQSGVGDVRQALEQALINEQVGNFNFDQYAPFLKSQALAGLAAGLPGGSVTATGSVPPPAPLWQTALGGAATGAALGTAIAPGVGTVAGGVGGALLPFLFR